MIESSGLLLCERMFGFRRHMKISFQGLEDSRCQPFQGLEDSRCKRPYWTEVARIAWFNRYLLVLRRRASGRL